MSRQYLGMHREELVKIAKKRIEEARARKFDHRPATELHEIMKTGRVSLWEIGSYVREPEKLLEEENEAMGAPLSAPRRGLQLVASAT